MRNAGLWVGVAIAGVLGAAVLGGVAQEPDSNQRQGQPAIEEPPIFRGGTAFVYVDVYPRRDGTPIEGLTVADFEVRENGQPQNVELFEFIRHETAIVDTDRRDPTSQADGDRQASDPRNRVFVVYLDPYHASIEGSTGVENTVMGFLQRAIGPTDVFGVMTPEMSPSQLVFGRRMETIEGDLEAFFRWAGLTAQMREQPRSQIEHRLIACSTGAVSNGPVLAAHREDTLLSNLESLMYRLGELREERKNVLFISEGWVPTSDRRLAGLAGGGRGGIPTIGVGPTGRLGAGNQQPYGRDDEWCDRQFARLSSMDFERRFRDLLQIARRSNVTFYPVDLGGLRVSGSRGARDTLLTLAENTDGVAIVDSNDTAPAARRLADTLSAYYLLGYYSTNSAADGRYREIDVIVRQPGVSVSARPGYFAPTAEMIAAASAPRGAGPTAVDEELGRLARSRPDTDLFAYGVATEAGLRVVAELGSRVMSAGGWSGGADVRLTLAPATGPAITVTGQIAEGARAAIVAVPAEGIGDGPWLVDVRASAAGGRAGRSAGNEGPYDSGIEIVPSTGQLLGDPLLYRATPSPRSVPKPVADFQYRRVERLHAEWPVLQALTSQEARLLDRQGAPLSIPPTVSAGGDEAGPAVMVDLPLSPLSEGEYVIELTATSGDITERKLLAFRVVR